MNTLQNLTWWQGVLVIIGIVIAVLVPVYKSVGILPFSKKKEEEKPHECPAGIKEQVCDIRDMTIRIETKVDDTKSSLNSFRDNMLILTGQMTEMVSTIKEELE